MAGGDMVRSGIDPIDKEGIGKWKTSVSERRGQ
jgi:hypothetical protein